MALVDYTDIAAIPFRGGCVTSTHKSLLPFGGFSAKQNIRDNHPGFRKRPGQTILHTVADNTNGVLSLYQFRKRRIDETHFFGQFSDGDVLKATNVPPAPTTGAFGSEVFSGTGTGEIAASWGNIDDILLYSNGVDQHQIYAGTANYIDAFIVFGDSSSADNVPENGTDYTVEATDGLTSTAVILDNLSTYGTTLVTNGTFPSGITGWTDNSTGDGTFAFDTNHAELDANTGTAAMGQTITLISGRAYTLTFTISENCTGLVVTGGTAAYEGTQHFTQTYTSTGSKTITFTAAGATLYLNFKSSTNEVVSLDDVVLVSYGCVFICTPIPANRLTWTISLPNGTAAVGTLSYRKNDNTWADTTEADGTISSGKTLGQNGSMIWTHPADEIPCYMFGRSGFWYRWETATQLDSEVEVTKVTYGSAFQSIVNVWDGVIPYAIEAMFYDQSAGTYSTFATGAIEIDSMVHESGAGNDDTDRLYFNSPDPIMGVYIDVGDTPNTTATSVVYGIKAWTGAAFTTVGTITDGTNGLKNSGWVTWPRLATVQPTQFKTTQYYAYWYYFWIGTATLSSDVQISILTMPYFDIAELGRGQCNCIWKNRPVVSFTLYPNYLYLGAEGRPCSFNGDDYGILVAGDGRRNKITAMRRFHNELVVFQEERGVEGGCITLFQGYSPSTWGKLLISSKIGTFSDKTVAVVDGVLTSTRTDEEIKNLIFFLSLYGICVTDGLTVSIISDDIQNYFDPTKAECIRRGYEDKMWLAYDSAFNVIRIGLVSGASATTPNVFLVFDLIDKAWGFDSLGQSLLCMAEGEAGSGAIPIIQVGGGVADGFVYQLNTGTNDSTSEVTAIDSYVTMELNARGEYIQLNEMLIRNEVQASGNIALTLYKNSVSAGTKSLAMTAEVTNQTIRRHRFNLNLCDQNISVKIQNNAISTGMALLDVGFRTQLYKER